MSWKTKSWNEVLEIKNGRNQRKVKAENGIYPIYGSGGIIGRANDFLCEAGTTIIGRKGSINNPIFVQERFWNVDTAFGLMPKKDLDKKYFYYFCTTYNFLKHNKATTLPSLTKTDLLRIQIPLPPLATQRKIAEVMDKADAIRKRSQKILAKYDQLAQSVFLEMFGDPVKNEKGWEIVTIRDLVSEVKYGTSSKAEENGELPYLRMNNISYSGYMDYGNLKFINVSEKEREKYISRKGDILFNRTNSKELVGKTGLITDDEERIIAGYLIRIRTNELANPYFLWAHLNSKWAKMTLEKMCKSIVGMANINAQELQNIKILKAPISLQNQFATIISQIEKQKAQTQLELDRAEALYQSLLQRAFTGALFPETTQNELTNA